MQISLRLPQLPIVAQLRRGLRARGEPRASGSPLHAAGWLAWGAAPKSVGACSLRYAACHLIWLRFRQEAEGAAACLSSKSICECEVSAGQKSPTSSTPGLAVTTSMCISGLSLSCEKVTLPVPATVARGAYEQAPSSMEVASR